MDGLKALLDTITAWGFAQADSSFKPFLPQQGSRVRCDRRVAEVVGFTLYGNLWVNWRGQRLCWSPHHVTVIEWKHDGFNFKMPPHVQPYSAENLPY